MFRAIFKSIGRAPSLAGELARRGRGGERRASSPAKGCAPVDGSDPFSTRSRADEFLASRALREANRTSPEFSPALHRKIMRAVALSHRTPAIARRPSAALWRATSMIPAGLAAAVTLAVSPLPSQLYFANQTAQIPAAHSVAIVAPSVPEKPVLAINRAAHDINVRMNDALQTAMVTQQWAGLDHDVRSATQFFVAQVPLRSAWEGDGTAR